MRTSSASLAGKIGRVLFAITIAVGFLAPVSTTAQAQDDLLVLPAVSGPENFQISYNSDTGGAVFLSAPDGEALAQPDAAAATAAPEEAALSFLRVYGPIFGLNNPDTDLTVMRSAVVEKGRSVVRFQQVVSGIPVVGAELIVNMDAARSVISISGKTLPAEEINLTPSIDAEAAKAQAISYLAEHLRLPAEGFTASEPTLWVYNSKLVGPGSGLTSLVWRMDVSAERKGQAPVKELVLLDAHVGFVALHFNQIEEAKVINTYDSNFTSNLPGAWVCDQTDLTCAAGVVDAQLAHRYANDTYNAYFTLGRDSIDGAGMNIISSVQYRSDPSEPYSNAFWNGVQMVYGEGFSQADDVVGHELTHGVTEHTSNLFYWAESGAINESMSDVFGEWVDQTNTGGTDTADVKWLMGEDIPGIGAIRSMADPTLYGDPDRILSPNYWLDMYDGIGVHANSGVNNKAAFLMVDGGKFRGIKVTGLGWPKVIKLYYIVNRDYLTTSSTYLDLYNALNNLCALYKADPTSGYTKTDCANVKKALKAVQMNTRPGSRGVDDGDKPFTYFGTGWSNGLDANAKYGTVHTSATIGDYASFKDFGARYRFYYLCAPGNGTLTIYMNKIGGKVLGTLDQSSCNGYSWSEYSMSGLSSGVHKLYFVHSAGGPVNIDAVLTGKATETVKTSKAVPWIYKYGSDLRYFSYGGNFWDFGNQYSYYPDTWIKAKFSSALVDCTTPSYSNSAPEVDVYVGSKLLFTYSQIDYTGFYVYGKYATRTIKLVNHSGGWMGVYYCKAYKVLPSSSSSSALQPTIQGPDGLSFALKAK